VTTRPRRGNSCAIGWGEEDRGGEWFLIIYYYYYYYIKIIGPCWHKRCVQAARYTRTKYGGGIFWRPSVNRVAAVVMVPRTHNRNSWPEILRSTNRLSTATHPSTIVSRCRHVYDTTAAVISTPYGRLLRSSSAGRTAENNLLDVGGAAVFAGYARKGFPLPLPPKPITFRQLTVVTRNASVCDFANPNCLFPY